MTNVLHFIISLQKCISQSIISLYVAFVDIKAAFDYVSNQEMNTTQSKFTSQGHLTTPIPTAKDVKEGCIMALFKFVFCINVIKYLARLNFHPSKVTQRDITVVL
ncbi:hypothetical protein E2320_005169 [Naja naja]|nr:hypothetical protein E2320_005169 [Naja naja]